MNPSDLLRSLQRPGSPVVLPNAWDAATARAVVAAGFPVVATTSGGVAGALGHEDHEQAPAREMLDAAARICRSVDVPVTVDAEAGYGLAPEVLVAELHQMGAAGCNLEDTDHSVGAARDMRRHASWLQAVRTAADDRDYGLVINARIDVFLPAAIAGSDEPQITLVPEALERAHAFVAAGADCVYPIALWQTDALTEFVAQSPAPVNVLATPRTPPLSALAEMGVARVSHAAFLYHDAMAHFRGVLDGLVGDVPPPTAP